MAVYINVGHVPSDGGKPWKHLDGRCPHLQRRAEAGFPVRRVKNVDAGNPVVEDHSRRRCECFVEQRALRRSLPRFLAEAARLEEAKPGRYWIYNIFDEDTRTSQVGMASSLEQRLRSRWRATCRAGFPPDGIPWLNARLAADRSFEPAFEATSFETGEEALTAERSLRRSLREAGWVVSSDA